jgi:hypothetical protein
MRRNFTKSERRDKRNREWFQNQKQSSLTEVIRENVLIRLGG